MEQMRRWGSERSYNIDRSDVPVFRVEGRKSSCDLRPVLASNFVPTCRSIAMATAARPRVVENNHVNVKNIRRVSTEGLDDGTFCQ